MNSSRWPVLELGCLSLLMLFVGCASHERESLPESSENRSEDSAVMVTVEPVARRSVQRTVEAVGTLHGYEEVTISTKIEGTVKTIHHDVADRVAPGEILLEIDPTNYELAVGQAEKSLQVELAKLGLSEPPGGAFDVSSVPPVMQAAAKLENAKVKLERTHNLRMKNVNTAEELADRLVDQRVAQAEHDNQVLIAKSGVATIRVKQEDLAVAKQELSDTKIRVPKPTQPLPDNETRSGGLTYAITKRSVSEGTLVRSGTEVFQLVLDRTLKLKAAIPERHGGVIELGQKAEIHTAAYPKPFIGRVTRINPAVDPDTRTFEVEVQVANPTKIFLVENGLAREVQVTQGTQSTDWVEVQKPALPESAQVITSGHSALADGAAVKIRTEEGPASSKPQPESK
jgi:membrane fusion protein (multidrug efflux system)